MTYKIVRLSGIHYPQAVEAHYRDSPGLEDESYDTQLHSLGNKAFVYGQSFSREMRSLGQDAHEIIYDVPQLQNAWAKEHSIPCNNQSDIVIAQLQHLRPDVIYFQDIYSLPYAIRKNIKDIVPSIRLVVVYKGYPGAFDKMEGVDLLFVGTPGIQNEYEKRGIPATLMYHCFNPNILNLLPPKPTAASTITFIGSSGFGHGVTHLSRYTLLKKLMGQFPVQAYIDESDTSISGIVKENSILAVTYLLSKQSQKTLQSLHTNKHIPQSLQSVIASVIENKSLGVLRKDVASPWPVLPLSRIYPKQYHSSVFGIRMYETLQSSAITINRHTDGACGWAGNLRLFEATGAGTCLVTDMGKNMQDLFETDREIITYASPEECESKIRYLLEHEEERKKIALAGQQRTLKDHTMANRCATINEEISRILS